MLSLDSIIKQAIDEDLKHGDITSLALIEHDALGMAHITAKEDFVIAGIKTAMQVFETIDNTLNVEPRFSDGDKVKTGDKIISLSGRLVSMLSAERVALNFLQRLCAIATLTNRFVSLVSEYNVEIFDTRKTTPNLRAIEKAAVIAGGGCNHRMGLFDGILIKDNHIKHCGGVKTALETMMENRPSNFLIEIETKNLNEVKEVLDVGVDVIMFDNMTPEMVSEALELVSGKAITEVSGCVTLDNVREYAKAQPTRISIGALTHSAGAVDISLLIE